MLGSGHFMRGSSRQSVGVEDGALGGGGSGLTEGAGAAATGVGQYRKEKIAADELNKNNHDCLFVFTQSL